MMVSLAAIQAVGLLDEDAFGWHGYGADIDYALRARAAGMGSIVAETCFVSHGRRGTIGLLEADVETKVPQISWDALASKWGSDWPLRVGRGVPIEQPLVIPPRPDWVDERP